MVGEIRLEVKTGDTTTKGALRVTITRAVGITLTNKVEETLVLVNNIPAHLLAPQPVLLVMDRVMVVVTLALVVAIRALVMVKVMVILAQQDHMGALVMVTQAGVRGLLAVDIIMAVDGRTGGEE